MAKKTVYISQKVGLLRRKMAEGSLRRLGFLPVNQQADADYYFVLEKVTTGLFGYDLEAQLWTRNKQLLIKARAESKGILQELVRPCVPGVYYHYLDVMTIFERKIKQQFE